MAPPNIYFKPTMLTLDTGALFGLIPFRSEFIYYFKADILSKDFSKANKVVGIATTIHIPLTSMELPVICRVYLIICLIIFITDLPLH